MRQGTQNKAGAMQSVPPKTMRKYKKHYTAYQRHILAEFMTRKELNKLDRKYNEAKIDREIKKLKALKP